MRTLLAVVFMVALVTLTWPARADDSGRGMNHKLYAVPAPKGVVIDGNLNDWDWSGHIVTYDNAQNLATQSAELAMMYDADALYIGAKVKDLTPMLNRHTPAADADKAWMGDCLQVRLVTDRTLPFPYLSDANTGNDGQSVGQPLHLMLWYYTDGKEPALQIHKSMAYLPVRPEWAPHGVVPHDRFSAAYKEDADGKGYSLEYRIPWDTLNAAANHPVAGDVITATEQFLWGDGSGLNNIAAAYDLMSEPGFPWQTTAPWGKIIFSANGNIPRSWVDVYHKPDPPTPLTFDYDLPADGDVTVALYDKDNNIVRNIVAQAHRKAGHIVEKWDGLDAFGRPLPVGTYHWKGLYHDPITTRYVMSMANSGQPGWKTADGTGGWGGDYGPCVASCVAGNTMILGWTAHEAGWGIIATDLTGKKKWGLRLKNAPLLATDGTRFFAPGEEEGQFVNVYAVANGQPLAFGDGRQALDPPPGAGTQSNYPTGLTYRAGILYVSFSGRNLIGLYDAASGDLKSTIPIEQPGELGAATDGALYAASGNKLVKIAGGQTSDFGGGHVDSPAGVTFDAAGNVYVANHGALQNVSVFTAGGEYLRSIGQRGGRPVMGEYMPGGMLDPSGITIDGQGKLWVPEAAISMKRISVWDTHTGKLTKEFFGGCSYSPFAWVDPKNPHEAFFDNTIWNIDLDKGTWYPKSIFYAPKSDNAVVTGNGGCGYPWRVFTAHNGHQYAVSNAFPFGTVVWIREGDLFRPLQFLFRNRINPPICDVPPFAFMQDLTKYPRGQAYVWTDTNGDEEAQPSEVVAVPYTSSFEWMDADLNLYGAGVVFRPTHVSKNGYPTYDFAKPEKITSADGGDTSVDPDAKQLWTWSDGYYFTAYNHAGQKLWSYTPLEEWRSAINEGTHKPGQLIGATCLMGSAGRYNGLISYFGTAELVRDDGLFVAQVFEPGAKGNNGPNIFYVEFLAGQMFKAAGSNKTYIVSGDQDCRVSEVLGLDTVKDLAGGTYEYTQDLFDKSAAALADYSQKAASSQPLVLARGGLPGLPLADPVGKVVDDKRAFSVKASYDAKNIYFHYSVTSSSPLLNSMTDPQTIYKGGNLMDIQMATDPNADPKRTKPASGDIRLLISRRDDKTWAVIMRPKVAGFTGDPIKLSSPQGTELFDSIEATDLVELRDYAQSASGFTVTVVVPQDLIGISALAPGNQIGVDVGYIFGDSGGLNAGVRSYWHNNSFSANVVNDIPSESRLEPAEWGVARVE